MTTPINNTNEAITEAINEATAETPPDSLSRRTLLTHAAVAGIGVGVLGLVATTQTAQASTTPKQPEAETGHDYPMATPNAKNAKQYSVGVLGPAMLSLITSQIAVDKATDPAAKEFANFELREAIAVTTVLKEMKTPTPRWTPTLKRHSPRLKQLPKVRTSTRRISRPSLPTTSFCVI